MKYVIKSSAVSAIRISEDKLSISLDVTILYNTEEPSKLQDSSVGTTIVISLEKGDRKTLVSELEKSIQEWFDKNYNV